jgi:hypothetical protein
MVGRPTEKIRDADGFAEMRGRMVEMLIIHPRNPALRPTHLTSQMRNTRHFRQ